MMTADPTLENAIGGLKSGASDYIIKPFSIDHLSSVVRSVFEKAALSSELQREKALKKELEDAYAQLKATEGAKDAFLGRVNHELRTPLAIAVTSCELLSAQLQGPQKELCVKTEKALKWLQLEIGELLLYSGLLKGELKIEKAPVDLWTLLEETSAGLKFIYEDMAITVNLAREGESFTVPADARLMAEVFRQLLVNGVKFNKKGGAINVRVRYASDHIMFWFSDTGPGVKDDLLPHLFDSMVQAADYLTREVGGIGLGLATVKRIVEAHGGGVAAQKNPDGGMQFSLSLPRG
jgi:signal transduction histidine kinase